MDVPEAARLSPADIRSLDRDYRPFPPLATWPQEPPGAELWGSSVDRLAEARAEAPPPAFGELLREAMRWAAIDTGAIEGLYATDRGFTVTVAAMASAWEAALEREKGRACTWGPRGVATWYVSWGAQTTSCSRPVHASLIGVEEVAASRAIS